MKAVSFNIRCDYGQDGSNNFVYRRPLIEKKIREELPDLIAFQEVLPHVAVWLKETFTEYTIIGCGRSDCLDDEQETIAFLKDRYNLISMDTFWLSPTPYTPGSRYEEQSICPRSVTEAVLQDLKYGGVFRVLNIHLDHEGTLARSLGLKQIMNRLNRPVSFAEAPVILLGDFNALPDMPEISLMKEYEDYEDAAKETGGTFHDYGNLLDPEKIDYVFLKKPFKKKSAVLWKDCVNGVYLSDHYPVCVEIYMA